MPIDDNLKHFASQNEQATRIKEIRFSLKNLRAIMETTEDKTSDVYKKAQDDYKKLTDEGRNLANNGTEFIKRMWAGPIDADEQGIKPRALTASEVKDVGEQAQAHSNKPASKPTSKPIKLPVIGKQKSSSEQLADLQLQRLKKQQRQESLPGFKLPDIPKDTATSIVIGSLLATFLILIGAGTKFSQLWGYAFNAPISHGGGETSDDWDIPNMLHSAYDIELEECEMA